MDKRRGTVDITIQVDAESASWAYLLRSIRWDVDQFVREHPGVTGVSVAVGEVVYEDDAQRVNDAAEASDSLGAEK